MSVPLKAKKAKEPTNVVEVDRLETLSAVTVADYIKGVSAYIRASDTLTGGQKKSAQIRLSYALGRALEAELKARKPTLNLFVGERIVAGALRTVKADVSEVHGMDGLRLAIEIKPVNLAVGRAIWNRFGDIRTFAVNLHLKFPFAVTGGLMPIPIVEKKKGSWIEVDHLIKRACARFAHAGGRRSDGDAPHLLEGICVIAYDPRTDTILPDLPKAGTGLRWDEFVDNLIDSYEARYAEDGDIVEEEEEE